MTTGPAAPGTGAPGAARRFVRARLGPSHGDAAGDASSALPAPRRAGDEDQGGRGLLLVDVLSAAWGVEAAGSGKRVWFTVDLAG